MIRRLATLLILSTCLGLSEQAQADVFRDIGIGLDFAGFDIRGNRNPLSGGADMLITNTFGGQPFDFGAADISFRGPISLQISTGGRLLSQFDVSLTTAIDNRSTVQPLSYVYNYDVGGQSTTMTGSMLIDADFSLNGFGFYKLTVNYSSRQTVERDGQLVSDEGQFDSDFGPIKLSGNIFTDVISMLLSPVFERTGRANPLAALSPVSTLIDLDPAQRQALLKALSEGSDGPMDHGLGFQGIGSASAARFLSTAAVSSGEGRRFGLVVPEPPVLALLLLGIPAIMGRLRRPAR